MRISQFLWAILTVAVGVALFLVKHKVQDLEHKLVAKRAQIVRDQGAIRVLEAEWTYLNDPARLRRQSEGYLGFHPAMPRNIATIDQLPMRGAADSAGAPPVSVSTPAPATPFPGQSAPKAPQLRTELQPSLLQTASTERPSILSVTYARLQRLLLPTAAGATTPLNQTATDEAGK